MSLNFVSGYATMHTRVATADRSAGEVVALGNSSAIHHRDAKNGEQEAVAVGGGIYDGVANAAIAIGAKVNYNAGKVTATGGTGLGVALTASSADNDPILILHVANTPAT